ncbi:hypothetical protein QR680_009980 [Steinernema hermaphroditum]|uniref:Acyl-CoA thioesterase-like N-terminal HotDog domain-containing protein n=1 Tax=Steinernema hermaphroditum TaxID=289476 RepID=A0AA39INK0_9BILA|nr:hypothetical protein QR680_009980 [Steinernema hermaphroditum]
MGSLLEPVLSRHWTNVEEVAEDTFEGTCVSQEPDGRVYGGHVLAQSLAAAYHTAPEGFVVNSLHCYFVRGGREDVTITYKVKTVRNGRNFAVRFVEAMQQEKVIHIAEVSFQKNAAFPVISLSPVFPSVPAPESLEPVVSETMDRMTPQLDVRPCDWEVHRKEKTATKRCVWLKYRVPVGKSLNDHVHF